jgi:hypothetical protein
MIGEHGIYTPSAGGLSLLAIAPGGGTLPLNIVTLSQY